MREILFYLFFLLGFLSFAQTTDKGYWSSQAELEISIPNKLEYYYGVPLPDRGIGKESYGKTIMLERKPMWGANYSINYEWFEKFRIGALGGFTYMSYPSMLVSKLGGVLRYDATEELNMDFFVSLAVHFPLNKDTTIDLSEGKIGINFPVFKRKKYSIYLTSHLTLTFFRRLTPIFSTNENPGDVEFRGAGIGLGVCF